MAAKVTKRCAIVVNPTKIPDWAAFRLWSPFEALAPGAVVFVFCSLQAAPQERISSTVFFAAKLIFEKENYFTQILHNQTAYMVQKRLHTKGQNLIIMPMKV